MTPNLTPRKMSREEEADIDVLTVDNHLTGETFQKNRIRPFVRTFYKLKNKR